MKICLPLHPEKIVLFIFQRKFHFVSISTTYYQ